MDQEEVADWIKGYVARLLGMEPDGVDADIPFERYGLDSTAVVGLSGDLSELLSLKLDTNIVFHYPTVRALAEHVTSHKQHARARP